MEFNSFLWGLYRDAPEGRIAIDRDIADYTLPEQGDTPAFTSPVYFYEVSNDEVVENGIVGRDAVNLRETIREYATEQTVTGLDEAENLFTEIADEGLSWQFDEEDKTFEFLFAGGKDDQTGYMQVITSIEGLSAGLHDAHPEFFFPYLFNRRFDLFEQICLAFDLSLPQEPGKLQKRDRAMYYLRINRVLHDFRKCHKLSPQELNAFLYDFAPKNLTKRVSTDLPNPSRVWFVIGGVGGNGDFEYLDAADNNSVSRWQGNLETRRGDIVLMWCASPRSYLHSVWRAIDDGFNDPFFYYYTMIRVGSPVKITPLPFSSFSKHPLLGKKPAIRAHLQGASGIAFAVEEYAAICDLLQQKGFEVSRLPSAPDIKECSVAGIENERDVEQSLLEPLLRNLGFSDNDWLRQLSVRMGRGERNYPDYVLGCDSRPNEESAIVVIECKFDIDTKKELKEAFVQAKSYALRLQALMLALAARRGVWIFQQRKDGFSIDHFTFKTWIELSHPDTLHELSLSLGKRTIDRLFEQRCRLRGKAGK
jgi:hypothetical protein